MLIASIILILSFAVLVWSADKFVYGASGLARNLGISPMIIGLTIVAMGSSAPEIMVSANAALKGATDTSVGNAIGSNITNILLVLGITTLVRPLLVSSSTLYREMPILFGFTMLAWWVLYDNYLSFNEGILLAVLFFGFLGYLFYLSTRQGDKPDPLVDFEDEIPSDLPMGVAVFWLVAGLIMLPLSSHFLVDSAVVIAQYFGISELVIGLTIIAIGTSLPELAASVASVLKGEDDMAIGNIIGSNIFNILAVLSVGALINPSVIDTSAASRDIFVMIGATVLLLVMAMSFAKKARKINRIEGAILLSAFVGYQFLLFA